MNDEALIRLENLRKLSLSPAELVNRVGSTYSYWRDLLNGQKSFGEKAARRIEERLELRRGQLDEPSGESQNAIQRAANAWTKNVAVADVGSVRIPLISPVQAGTWTEIVDTFQPGDADEWLLTDTPVSSSTFALQIRGDSMLPKFAPGDRVIIDPEISPSPGDFVVAKNGDEEATFKKYRPRGLDANGGQVFELVPLNDDFATIRSDQQPVKIIGTMVEHRTYRRAR